MIKGLLFLAFLLMPAWPAAAGPNPNAKLILHAVPQSNRNTCLKGRVESPDSVVTAVGLYPLKYTVYALIVDGTPGKGIVGCQFGIAFNDTLKRGVDVIDWQECSLLNWPSVGFPDESGTGNLMTWNQDTDCDTTGMRVAGYFYVTAYSPDRLKLIPRPADGIAAVSCCGIEPGSKNADVLDIIGPDNLGFIDFGGGPGYNPWDPKQNLKNLDRPDFSPRHGTPRGR